MGNEELKPKPENPWGRGAEYEKELGETEVQKIRRGVAREAEDKTQIHARVTEGIERHEQRIEEDIFKRFRDRLERKGGTFSDICFVDSDGWVEMRERDPASPDLEFCTRLLSRGKDTITTEDMKNTAQRISSEFPEVVFSFAENPQRDRISYTATIKKFEE